MVKYVLIFLAGAAIGCVGGYWYCHECKPEIRVRFLSGPNPFFQGEKK